MFTNVKFFLKYEKNVQSHRNLIKNYEKMSKNVKICLKYYINVKNDQKLDKKL